MTYTVHKVRMVIMVMKMIAGSLQDTEWSLLLLLLL